MFIRKNVRILRILWLIALGLTVAECVTVVEPEFDFKDGLLFIEAFALSEPGLSTVSIKESIELNGAQSFAGVSEATVVFENVATGSSVLLIEQSEGFYTPDSNFVAQPGEEWRLSIQLADGRTYESTDEKITESVGLDGLDANFLPELTFDAGGNKFVAGHKITAAFRDPPGVGNYYLWKTRTFEPLIACLTCFNGVFRNGECTFQEIPRWQPKYFDYVCLTKCWRIRYGTSIPVFSDQFADGNEVLAQEIADIVYYRAQNILVEVQQMSINEATYKYFKTINDLIEESAGLNAPTPSALLGNLTNVSDSDEIVLGNFTAASVITKRIFIDRYQLNGVVDPDPFLHLETCIGCPTTFPCEEGEDRTTKKPLGWEE